MTPLFAIFFLSFLNPQVASEEVASVPGNTGVMETSPLPLEATEAWAILAKGRVKPLGTFAKETMVSVAGKTEVDGLNALDVFWGCHFDWPNFSNVPIVKISSSTLRQDLGFESGIRRFSYNHLTKHEAFQKLVVAGLKAEEDKDAATSNQRDAVEVYRRLTRLAEIADGHSLQLVPKPGVDGLWTWPGSLQGSEVEAEKLIYTQFGKISQAYLVKDVDAFQSAAGVLTQALRAANPEIYPSESLLGKELFYNSLNPFAWAWKLYLLGFFLVAVAGAIGYKLGSVALVIGIISHTLGLGLRWQIAGRAPVSDMYESLIFMGWGAIVIGMTLEFFSRKGYFAIASGLMGFLALAFAEHLPIDSSINPLVPVLANTSWLAIHVMTIMLSYSAFALAMGMGHVMLFLQFFKPGRTKQLRNLSTLLYKSLQIGVFFLAAGIAFGAIWANESWGRYWGWDPKETWSLITFFVYMIVVHARFAGWVSHFGLAVSSIASFLAVVMTYYGVNFLLGSGLHSYGFSEGGVMWFSIYLGIELLIIFGSLLRYRGALNSGHATVESSPSSSR